MVWVKTPESDVPLPICFGWIEKGNGGEGLGYHKRGKGLGIQDL